MQKNFYSNLPSLLHLDYGAVESRLLKEYGSVFIVRGGATPPPKVVFKDQAEVEAFQASVETSVESIGGFRLELQASALNWLKAAVDEAAASGRSITPRGADSAKRSYDDTVGLWRSRVEPALAHWVAEGSLDPDQAQVISAMTPFDQVPVVLELEEKGIYFAKNLSKSILYSVAPPGASQHLSMLAIDVNEFNDEKVRSILAENYWYQTVISDLPHFTFLGLDESQLPAIGLKRTMSGDRYFWVPDI